MQPGEHILTCRDSFGDGWNGGYISIYGNRYCEGNFGYEEINSFVAYKLNDTVETYEVTYSMKLVGKSVYT